MSVVYCLTPCNPECVSASQGLESWSVGLNIPNVRIVPGIQEVCNNNNKKVEQMNKVKIKLESQGIL